jgi:hypothetical protein
MRTVLARSSASSKLVSPAAAAAATHHLSVSDALRAQGGFTQAATGLLQLKLLAMHCAL